MRYFNSKAFLAIEYFFNCEPIQTNNVYRIALIILSRNDDCRIHKKKMDFFKEVIDDHFSC
jgi:hypothetical protein